MKKNKKTNKSMSAFSYIYSLSFIGILFFLIYAEVPQLFTILFCVLGCLGVVFITHTQLKYNNITQEKKILTAHAAKISEDYLKQEKLHAEMMRQQQYIQEEDITEMKEGFLNKLMKKPDEIKSTFKIYSPENMKTLDDIAGYDEVKEELLEIVDFLKNPKDYHDMGAKIPRGVLFVGPPGTGKTMFAKAIAGEAGVKFIYNSGSEFVEKFSGVGASRVRELFEEAKKDNEPCIIFIDEIDAIGGARNNAGNDTEKDRTLNQLLVEMDGFEESKNIVVLAATNRKDMLDSALLRPGRFDRQIQVGLPSVQERCEILKVHGKNKKIDLDFDYMNIAKKTPSFSGAQLAAVLNEAALLAVRNNQSIITNDLIDESIDRVIMGPAKKNQKYIDKERRLVAFHEAGHAVIGMTLADSMQLEKITIIPRGDAGGYNLFSEKEETFFTTRNSIIARITGLLAGRAAEELIFDDVTTGAVNDLQKATELARHFVCTYGMSELGLMQINTNLISEKTSEKIDTEINHLIDTCYENSKSLLNSHKPLLNAIANELLDKETIDSTQISQLAVQYC